MNSEFQSLTLRVSDVTQAPGPGSDPPVREGVMEQTTYFEHFRISTLADGSPLEVRRSGAAINYKATDARSGDPIMLQLIPIATVDQGNREQFEARVRAVQKLDHVNIARVLDVVSDSDHIGIVSEYVEGETTDTWLAAHGAMPADAVLRIGLQVVRALVAAAFHRLAHQAIEPSNIVIASGQSPDGGWPLIKLVNFGVAALDINSPGSAVPELASVAAPQFASPEQLLNQPLDFRSEIYSLGATMCFLLTGAVPLPAAEMKKGMRARRLPELRRAPRPLRDLLVHMLQENPENRPQAPVAFEVEMRDCLTKIERRQAIARKLGIPLAAVIPTKPRSTSASPFRQVVQGTVAVAALLLVAAVVAAFFLPEDKVPFLHRRDNQIGVQVGVPENTTTRITQNRNVPLASTPAPIEAPVAQTTSTPVEQTASVPPQIAIAESTMSPEPPAEGPPEQSDVAENSSSEQANSSPNKTEIAQTDEANASPGSTDDVRESTHVTLSSPARKKTSDVASTRRSTASTRSRISQIQAGRRGGPIIQFPDGTPLRARFVRALADGRVILRLPSGRTVLAVPEGSRLAPRQSHRRVIERDETAGPEAPFQPFDSDYPND